MKRRLFSFCVFSMVAISISAADQLPLSEVEIQKLSAYVSDEDEHIPLIWKGDPLAITLPVNAEKRVVFPEPIEAHLNGALHSDQLRIINNDQSLYLTALKPFSVTRMYVTLKSTHKIILFDVNTADDATQVMRTVKLASVSKSMDIGLSTKKATVPLAQSLSHHPTRNTNTTAQDSPVGSANSYVHAIRFAWQQLFAPKRLLNLNADFMRTPMRTQPWVSDLVYGDKVLAHPEISWVSGYVYVTAVELRNKYPHETLLNLQHDLCGQWQAATLYPRMHLKRAGDRSGDSTTLFLISPRPFSEMLESCHGSA